MPVSFTAPIVLRSAKLKVFSNLGVLGCDLVRAASNALAANFAAIARDDAKDLAMTLAAERAVAIAHDANSEDWPMPQSE